MELVKVVAQRSPNPLRGVNTLIDETLTVRDLVSRQIWTFNPGQPAQEAYASMHAQSFDVAAVGPEPVMKFVSRLKLKNAVGKVEDYAEDISVRECVDRSLPIGELLKHLANKDHVFVLNGDHVRWIVTRADLNAPVVGIVALSYLTAIEGGFRELARTMDSQHLLGHFDQKNRAKILDLYERRKRRNTSIGIHDCLTLGDWFRVVRGHQPFLEALGFVNAHEHAIETNSFPDLRNTVAHGGGLLDELIPEEALLGFQKARRYASRVWDAVDRKQPIWDTYLSSEIARVKKGKEVLLTGANSLETVGDGVLHVITAWNPGSVGTDAKQNEIANKVLRKQLETDGVNDVQRGVGRSIDRAVAEESFVVKGLTRKRAAAIGGLFDQAAIFEIDNSTVRVVRCPDAAVMAERPRRV